MQHSSGKEEAFAPDSSVYGLLRACGHFINAIWWWNIWPREGMSSSQLLCGLLGIVFLQRDEHDSVPGSRGRYWDLRAPYPQCTWSTIGGHPGSNGSPPTVKALASHNASHPVPMLCHLSATCVTGAKPCVVTYVLSGDGPPA